MTSVPHYLPAWQCQSHATNIPLHYWRACQCISLYLTYWMCEDGFVHEILQVYMEDIPSSVWLPGEPILHFDGHRWHHWHINRWFTCQMVLLALIFSHWDHLTMCFPLSPWMHGSKANKHVFGLLWSLIPDWLLKHCCRIFTHILQC